MAEREVSMIEPAVMTPVYVDGVGGIEVDKHGIAKLTFYVDQRSVHCPEIERQVALRVIMPAAAMSEIAGLMMTADGDKYASMAHRAKIRGLM